MDEESNIFKEKFNKLYEKIQRYERTSKKKEVEYFLYMKCQRVNTGRYNKQGERIQGSPTVPYVKILKSLKERRKFARILKEYENERIQEKRKLYKPEMCLSIQGNCIHHISNRNRNVIHREKKKVEIKIKSYFNYFGVAVGYKGHLLIDYEEEEENEKCGEGASENISNKAAKVNAKEKFPPLHFSDEIEIVNEILPNAKLSSAKHSSANNKGKKVIKTTNTHIKPKPNNIPKYTPDLIKNNCTNNILINNSHKTHLNTQVLPITSYEAITCFPCAKENIKNIEKQQKTRQFKNKFYH